MTESPAAPAAANQDRNRDAHRPLRIGGIVAVALAFYTVLSGFVTSMNSYLSYRVLVLGMMGATALPVGVFELRRKGQDGTGRDGENSGPRSVTEARLTLLFIAVVSAYVAASFQFPGVLTAESIRILVLSAAFICLLCYFAIAKIVQRQKMSLVVSAGQARSERIVHRFFTSLSIFLLFPMYVLTVLLFPPLRGRLEMAIIFCGLTGACLIGFWSLSKDIRELANLLEKASKVARGEANELIDTPRDGELAELANAFNMIIAERDETIEKLEEAKERIQKLVKRVRRQASTDELTGIYNRASFRRELRKEIARAERQKKNVVLAILDVDGFKKFNDTHGHPAGDRMLRELAGLIQDNIRASDTVCRYGGDEFTVILPETGEAPMGRENGVRVLERVRRAIQEHEFQGDPEGNGHSRDFVTVSIGIAVYPDDGRQKDNLVRHADRMLYRAKEDGRNRVSVGRT